MGPDSPPAAPEPARRQPLPVPPQSNVGARKRPATLGESAFPRQCRQQTDNSGRSIPPGRMLLMAMPDRLRLVSLLLSGSLLAAVPAGVAAQDHQSHVPPSEAASAPRPAMQQVLWSDPASWPGGKVPGEGDTVTIARDKHVVLDVSPPVLRSLTIEGKLSFSNDRDLEPKTDWIYVPGGELEIGSESRPHTRQATITLTDNVPGEDLNTMGDRGIMLMSGTLNIHGDREHTWTKLANTAEAGSTQIEVLDAKGWRAGDEIVLAPTDFDPRQAERRRITAIRGNRLTLDRPLEYMHFGKITFGVDERGEVGLLTRNFRIQASEDSESSYFGGHIMAMSGSKMYVSGVELSRMGQHLVLARYPIH